MKCKFNLLKYEGKVPLGIGSKSTRNKIQVSFFCHGSEIMNVSKLTRSETNPIYDV